MTAKWKQPSILNVQNIYSVIQLITLLTAHLNNWCHQLRERCLRNRDFPEPSFITPWSKNVMWQFIDFSWRPTGTELRCPAQGHFIRPFGGYEEPPIAIPWDRMTVTTSRHPSPHIMWLLSALWSTCLGALSRCEGNMRKIKMWESSAHPHLTHQKTFSNFPLKIQSCCVWFSY